VLLLQSAGSGSLLKSAGMATNHKPPIEPRGRCGRSHHAIRITGLAAAVAKAIYNLSGRRIRDLPITLDKLLRRGQAPRQPGIPLPVPGLSCAYGVTLVAVVQIT
jgi:hypothetical protein